MEENDKDIILAVAENIEVTVEQFCNDHAVKVYAPKLLTQDHSSSTPASKTSKDSVSSFPKLMGP